MSEEHGGAWSSRKAVCCKEVAVVKCDVLIHNGRIIDGKGNLWYWGSVAIKDGRILQVGRKIELPTSESIDAKGMIICPGFIDAHSHSDFVYFVDSAAQSKIRQGVTTEVIGNCGVSGAPWMGAASNCALGMMPSGFSPSWRTFEEYLEALAILRKPVNVAALVGHGTLRAAVMGTENRPWRSDESSEMKRVLSTALNAGAFGLSTGLFYAPGSYATKEELVELARIVGEQGGILASHHRDEGTYSIGFLNSVAEIISIAEEGKVPLQISHLKAFGPDVWGQSTKALEAIEGARERKMDVTCDQYPYCATGGNVAADILPISFQGGKRPEDIGRDLRSSKVRDSIYDEVADNIRRRGGAENLTVANYAPDQSWEGRSIQHVAVKLGKDPTTLVLDMLVEAEGYAVWVSHALNEQDVENIMRYHGTMIGSDGRALSTEGPLSQGNPHPRNYGAFPRVLSVYVHQKGTLHLEEAIRKMTSLPAQTFGLAKRGVIEEGGWADIVLLDETEIVDASYSNPKKYPDGIPYVMVNGKWVIKDGNFTRELPGQALYRES